MRSTCSAPQSHPQELSLKDEPVYLSKALARLIFFLRVVNLQVRLLPHTYFALVPEHGLRDDTSRLAKD